jgi:hypothetical protein
MSMSLISAVTSLLYRLENAGDAIERKWAKAVAANFGNYEPFWIAHVVPITWRMVDTRCLYVRSSAPKPLKKLATYNYGVFLHLAGCHEELEAARQTSHDDTQLFARLGVYTFYSRLYSVSQLVEKFLEAVKEVVDRYRGTHNRSLRARLEAHSSGDLYMRYNEAFKTRTKDY